MSSDGPSFNNQNAGPFLPAFFIKEKPLQKETTH
jgi:hypothetical protein